MTPHFRMLPQVGEGVMVQGLRQDLGCIKITSLGI